jgi:uncharacterized protein YchJ
MFLTAIFIFTFGLMSGHAEGYSRVGAMALRYRSRLTVQELSVPVPETRLFAGFGSKKDAVSVSKVPDASAPCACGSGSSYGECCMPYHSGKDIPPNPVKVVRSRFSALVYKVVPYLMATTHKSHKEYVEEEQKSKRKAWERDLRAFSEEYNFLSLEFDNEDADSKVSDDATTATVSFVAKLQRVGLGDRPAEEMRETSTFTRDKAGTGPWLYSSAIVKNPFKNITPDVKPQQRAVKTLKKGVPKGNQG